MHISVLEYFQSAQCKSELVCKVDWTWRKRNVNGNQGQKHRRSLSRNGLLLILSPVAQTTNDKYMLQYNTTNLYNNMRNHRLSAGGILINITTPE
jgi:hypothetical protein